MQHRVLVNGALGKMGRIACETVQENPEFILVGELQRQDDLKAAVKATCAHIVIDVTSAQSVYQNSLAIIEAGARPIIGTSGLTEEEIKTLTRLCEEKRLGGIIAPNFSIGALLMMRFAAMAAKYMPEVEIIEAHHQQKLDAPSGTAMKTAELIAKARRSVKNILPLKELVPHARGATYQDVSIHSLRLPGVLARQQVLFGAIGETLTITHDSIDRASFKPGILLACQKVLGFDTLYYGLETLLD